MNLKRAASIISLAIFFSLSLVPFVSAQEATGTAEKTDKTRNVDPSKEYSTSEMPEDTYLAKFHAIDVAEKLIGRNLEQIYLLNVIVQNFDKDGGKKWKSEYDDVYNGYKKAMEFYYKRNIIYARVELENNREKIRMLMKKMAEVYRDDTQAMLNKCADRILLLHLDAKTKSDPNKNEQLFQNQLRLRISYGQFDDAISCFTDNDFEGSLYHFRVAKSYAIRILEDLVEVTDTDTPESIQKKVDAIKVEYKLHKADNLNRIYRDKESAGGKEGK